MSALPRSVATVVAVAIATTMSACGDAGSGSGPDAAVSPSSPVSAPSPTPSVAASAPATSGAVTSPSSRARCTLVLGMSVTANWFLDGGFESLPGIDDERWELIWESGHDLILYADPAALPYSATPVSPCAADPDRVLFQIAARDWEAEEAVATELRSSIANIRTAWPSVRVIELIPIVGGPESGPCYDPDVPDKGVLASFMNPSMVEAIASVANGTDVVAGPDLLLADCAQYRDGTGHLTPEGSAHVASLLAERYGS